MEIMHVRECRTKEHADFTIKVFVMESAASALYLRKRYYFPSGNYWTEPDIRMATGDETALEMTINSLLGG